MGTVKGVIVGISFVTITVTVSLSLEMRLKGKRIIHMGLIKIFDIKNSIPIGLHILCCVFSKYQITNMSEF